MGLIEWTSDSSVTINGTKVTKRDYFLTLIFNIKDARDF